MIKIDEHSEAQWYYSRKKDMTLAIDRTDRVVILGRVERMFSGRWRWVLLGPGNLRGEEPTRDLARSAAEKCFEENRANPERADWEGSLKYLLGFLGMEEIFYGQHVSSGVFLLVYFFMGITFSRGLFHYKNFSFSALGLFILCIFLWPFVAALLIGFVIAKEMRDE